MLVPGLLCAIAIAGLLAWNNGYRLYIVETGSMAPLILSGDAVLDGPADGTYKLGEVITFRHSNQSTDLVTHRITEVVSGLIHTKGDANRTADAFGIRPDQVEGVYLTRLPRLGYILVFLRQPGGIASIIVGVLAFTLLWRMLFSSAKKRAQSEAASTQAPSAPPS